MNYIFIDTKTGKYGNMHSRLKVEQASEGKLKRHFLANLFTRNRTRRITPKVFSNDRFIVIPVPKHNEVYQDKLIIGNIVSFEMDFGSVTGG